MLARCYSSYVQRKQPTYVGCQVCPEWLYLSKFEQWFNTHYRPGFNLDKDILVPGNKVYGPDTCVFVPPHINAMLTDHRAARGNLPLGVSRNRASYIGICQDPTLRKQVTKYCATPEEAHEWYKQTKRDVARRVAEQALAAGDIDERVYTALLRRKFDGSDEPDVYPTYHGDRPGIKDVGRIHGVGVNDVPGAGTVGGLLYSGYLLWRNMLTRCYSPKAWKKHPTYKNCIVSQEWLRLSVFLRWYNVNYRKGYHLDKDILVPGNKVYGPDTCVFVPSYINVMLTANDAGRGAMPLGVTAHRRKPWHALVYACTLGRTKPGRTFRDLGEATRWYNKNKGHTIRTTATLALLAKEIDDRTYCGLIKHAEIYEIGQRN